MHAAHYGAINFKGLDFHYLRAAFPLPGIALAQMKADLASILALPNNPPGRVAENAVERAGWAWHVSCFMG